MAFVSDTVLDGALTVAQNSDQIIVCSALPADYYEACDPPVWASGTYAVGDVVKPSTFNGLVAKCTTAGTTGTVEPTWPTAAGATVTDGTAVWTMVSNYGLASATLGTADFTISTDTSIPGRKLTIAAKNAIPIYYTGASAYVAVVSNANKALRLVFNETSGQTLYSGNTVNIPSAYYALVYVS